MNREEYNKWLGDIINELRGATIPVFDMAMESLGIDDLDEFVQSDKFYDTPWAWTTDRRGYFHLDCRIEKVEDGVVHLFETGEGHGERHEMGVDELPVETILDLYFDYLPKCLEKSD